jgi:hypothetical protein
MRRRSGRRSGRRPVSPGAHARIPAHRSARTPRRPEPADPWCLCCVPPFQPNGDGARRSNTFGLCDQSGRLCGCSREPRAPARSRVLADIPSRLPEVMADPAIAERVIVNPKTPPAAGSPWSLHCPPPPPGPPPSPAAPAGYGLRDEAGVSGGGEHQRVVPHVADCGDGLLPPPRPFTTAIAVTNAVTVILTFTTASQ